MNKIVERNIKLKLSSKENLEQIEKIGKAISTRARLEILQLLSRSSMSVVEISQTLNLPVSSTAHHIKLLEDAGLILTETQPGIRGSLRLCIGCVQNISLECLGETVTQKNKTATIDMPVGHFYDCNVTPTCGMANEKGLVNVYDNPAAFFSPEKVNAQLIWFQSGFIEYRFPNHFLQDFTIDKLSFSMEICSEAPGFRDNWPSDITISINQFEIATYTSPGDFGSRLGKLNPDSWGYALTQYGLLKTFSIRDNGVYIDGILTNSKITLKDLNIKDFPYVSLKVIIKDTAKHKGGINIFGEKFGDHAQGILMSIDYK